MDIKIKLLIPILITGIFISCSKDHKENNLINYDAAYVVNGENNSISVINLETNKVEHIFKLTWTDKNHDHKKSLDMQDTLMSKWPQHVFLSPDKSKLAITAPGMECTPKMMQDSSMGSSMMNDTIMHKAGKLIVLDAINGSLIKEIALEGMGHNASFSPDGKELWTAIMMPEAKVKVYDATSFSLINTIKLEQMPSEIIFSEDGKKVLVSDGMSNMVTVIDAITKVVVETTQKEMMEMMLSGMTNMMEDSVRFGFMPAMAVQNKPKGQLWVTDPDNSKVHYWTMTETGLVHGGEIMAGKGAHSLEFSPDGTTCYVTNQNEGTISVVDVNSKTEKLKISVGGKPIGIALRYK